MNWDQIEGNWKQFTGKVRGCPVNFSIQARTYADGSGPGGGRFPEQPHGYRPGNRHKFLRVKRIIPG